MAQENMECCLQHFFYYAWMCTAELCHCIEILLRSGIDIYTVALLYGHFEDGCSAPPNHPFVVLWRWLLDASCQGNAALFLLMQRPELYFAHCIIITTKVDEC